MEPKAYKYLMVPGGKLIKAPPGKLVTYIFVDNPEPEVFKPELLDKGINDMRKGHVV